MAVITFYIKYFCFLFLHTFSYYILFICELNWIIFPPTGFSSGTCATKFIYSAFPNGWAASTAGEGQSAAVSAASTTSAEPARSEGSGGGLFSGVTQQQLQHISHRTFHQPLETKRRLLPSPAPSSGLLFSSRPGSLALLILDFFFFVVVILFSLLAQDQAMKLKP